MNRVAIVGSFNIDHVWRASRLPRPGETLVGEYSTGAGGKGFNQAVAARRAGAETAFICALGNDAGGALARQLAADDGIQLHAFQAAEATGTAGIHTDHAGRNSIVIGNGANSALDARFILSLQSVLGAAAVVLAQLESPPDSIRTALRASRDRGGVTMLNPAPANAPVEAGLLEACDVLTPNETEFSTLLQAHDCGTVDPDAICDLDGQALHALCRALLPHGIVVITLGAAGAFVSHPAGSCGGDPAAYYRVPGERAAVVDSTGAGDAFNGALAAALANDPGAAFSTHVRFASRYAALSTERPGAAASMPTRDDVRRRFG